MKKTYRLEVKRLCRERLREFINKGFTPGRLGVVRVLCLAGREALEVFEVYDRLGIPRKNIVCLEKDRKFSNELRRRYLGIQIRHQTLDEFIDDSRAGQFGIVSLDLTGQLGTYAHALQRLRARGRVDDHAIFFTNFCGAREAEASKGFYALTEGSWEKHSPVEVAAVLFKALHRDGLSGELVEALQYALRWLFAAGGVSPLNGTLRHRRSEAIHKGVRQMLRSSTNTLAGIAFRECDHDGSLSREVRKFLRPNVFENFPDIAMEAAAVYRQQLAVARKQHDVMPPNVSKMLVERVEERIQEIVTRFARGYSSKLHDLDIAAMSQLLISALESFMGREQSVVAAESYKYISDGGTPMYADMMRTRRVDKFDVLQRLVPTGAETLDELLKPIEQLSQPAFDSLIYQLERGSKSLNATRWQEAHIPPRIELGRESVLRPRRARATLNLPRMKEEALRLLALEPFLTIEDVALAVDAESTQQVAAWKAHMTLGSYSDGSVEALASSADRELEAGRCQSALEITKRLLRRNPSNVRLLTTHAKCLAQLGEHRKALAVLRRALDVEPGNVELLVRKGNVLRVSGQYDNAEQAFEEALRVDPCSVAALVGRGEALLGQEKLAAARSIFESAQKIDPFCFAAKFGRANCLVALEGGKSALAAFDDLARQYSDAPQVWYNRAIVRIYLNRHLAAIDDLSRAVERDPQFFLAWFNLGHCYFTEDRLESAYRAFSRAVAVSPGDLEAHKSLLMVCRRVGRDEEFDELVKWLDSNAPTTQNGNAHAELERALQLVPIDHRALMRRGQALFDQGSYEASVRVFGHLLDQVPTYCEALIGRAAALSRLMRFGEALTDLYRVRELDPESPDVWHHIHRTRADRDRSRASAGACVSSDVSDSPAATSPR